MSAPLKLAAFAAALTAVFGLAALAGAAIGPDRDGDGDATPDAHGGSAGGAHGGAADPVRGLATADEGLTLALDTKELERGRPGELRFRIVGAGGAPVRDYDVEHERRMHVIVVRRDGSGFQHLHPELNGDGTWTVPLTLRAAGGYRVFADFSHDGEARTLAADLTVDGDADYRDFPAPKTTVTTPDGYKVRIDAHDVAATGEAELGFTLERDGRPVTPEPYLGARGHLVALREGDLAFLHVHPDEDSLSFMARFPTEGRYRLYLQFKHEGSVHTAAFTQEVTR